MSSTRVRRQFGLLAVALVMLCAVGCSEPDALPNSTAKKDIPVSPEEVLRKLRESYSTAKSYADNAVLKERGVSRARGTVTEVPYWRTSLVFDRPNRYGITFEYGVGSQNESRYQVLCDGARVRSAAHELAGQIHEAIAPRIVSTENFIPEPELRQSILEVSVENIFPQMAMLVAAEDQNSVFPRATSMKLLAEDKIEENRCYRLALTEPEGTRILWIDKEKSILRRMELPIDNQRREIDPTGQYMSLSIDLDFEDIVMDAEFDDAAFDMKVPGEVRLVRRFIPPPPTGPNDDLGQPVKEFVFTDLEGAKLSPADLQGKVTVLEFWSTDCPPCKAHTPLLEAAYQQLKDDTDVAFYGVSTDPKGLATTAVAKTLNSWGATFPLLRDLDKDGYYSLEVKATPTLMLLGPDGRLQAFHVGMLENADELVQKVRQVQAGEDLVRQAKEAHAKELQNYEAILDAATIQGSLVDTEVMPADHSPRKMPEHLQLDEVWQTKFADLSSPGDVALIEANGSPQEVLVLDDSSRIVRFDSSGRILGRVELPSTSETDFGFIRTAVDANGARGILVSGVGWQQVHLFNSDWKHQLTFPDEPHSGIGDARFLESTANGSPAVLVGYWGGLGVQVGTLDGQRRWTNRHLDHVVQVVRGPTTESAEQAIWCTSTRGTIFEISADGQLQREFPVVGHTMAALEPRPLVGEQSLCGLSLIKPGQYALVSFNYKGEAVWSYELPQGDYLSQFPVIQRISLPGHENARVVAGPEGSLLFVASDGTLIDRFDYGDTIKGLAAGSFDDGKFLWVSAGNRLTAWRLSANEAP